MVYLFIGEDSGSKDLKLKALRQQYLSKDTESFNLDVVYAPELTRKALQEKLIYLPVKSSQRILVIKDAQALKEEARDFLLEYVTKPRPQVVLVLDVFSAGKPPEFISRLQRHCQVIRFKEARPPDAFALSHWIELRRPDAALRVLDQLMKNGERPERILGGLRYAWEKDTASLPQMKKKLRLLLHCDIDIKTGRLKPSFALEKLVIGLCAAAKSLG